MNEKHKKYIYACIAVIILVCTFLLGRASVHYDRAGNGNVTGAINQSQQTAQSVAAGVSDAQNTAGAIGQSSKEIGNTIIRIEGSLQQSGDAINDCQQILYRIQQRGKVEVKTN